MEQLIAILNDTACSLVVENNGEVTTYSKKGVRDLVWLLDNEPWRLCRARVADKVVGKAAAGLMAQGGVSEVYAPVMSRLATPLLDHAGIHWRTDRLVDRIIIRAGDTRCPLEQIVSPARNPREVERLLREHFEAMRNANTENQNQ